MLPNLSEYLIALLDLAEAEGRSAKRNVYALATAIAIFVLGTFLVAGAAGFLITGLYLGLVVFLHPSWVALICGVVLLALGVIALWLARERMS